MLLQHCPIYYMALLKLYDGIMIGDTRRFNVLINDRLRKVLMPILAVVSGILLFTATAAASLDGSLFNSSFHLSLINKYGIYSQLGKTVDNTLKNYLSDIKSGPVENEKQKEQLFSLVDKAVTPDMIRLNTDALVDGMMKYFLGEASFLPDIYLKPANGKPVLASHDTIQQASPVPEQSLAGIDRISLNVVLMYMDRNDLINTFSEIRLLRFALSYAPVFLGLFSFFLLVLAVSLSRGREIKARLSLATATAGISGLVAACLLLGLSWLYPPGYLTLSPLEKYIQKDSLYGYLRACIQRPVFSLVLFGAVLLTIALIIRFLPEHLLQNNFQKQRTFKKHGKALVSIFLVLLLAGIFLGKAEAMKGDFHSKDLGAALERLSGTSTYTAVTAARDETIYSVEIRAIDKLTDDPVQGFHILLNGTLSDTGKAYSESGTSDESGKVRFNIQRGGFKLEFDQSEFPESYKIPASYPFEIKAAGTTIITVNLEKTEAKKPGIAELLVLGVDNQPLENLELVAEEYAKEGKEGSASGKVYSFTNKEGVAVFKLAEGHYGITFLGSAFPQQYISPAPLGIDVAADATVKYSVKLATKAPLQKAAKKSVKK
jgi:hypothetical protein